ncbi:hypothetical protein CPT75_03410 [Butyrivibrio fibrisolvens]|uniref:Uncharacterized protein n=1 Tax=Butyrivibrio fibrisolvens TaxID=831 RepID=A0A317FX17_BUTFI|nr:hypothetical protein CPT75_03410 [Butyrivibrio fibrisolvens]
MTSEVSSLKAGTVLSENDISIKIATIDYNLILYKDTLARIEKSIRERDYEQLLLNCAYKPIINSSSRAAFLTT